MKVWLHLLETLFGMYSTAQLSPNNDSAASILDPLSLQVIFGDCGKLLRPRKSFAATLREMIADGANSQMPSVLGSRKSCSLEPKISSSGCPMQGGAIFRPDACHTRRAFYVFVGCHVELRVSHRFLPVLECTPKPTNPRKSCGTAGPSKHNEDAAEKMWIHYHLRDPRDLTLVNLGALAPFVTDQQTQNTFVLFLAHSHVIGLVPSRFCTGDEQNSRGGRTVHLRSENDAVEKPTIL